MLACKGFLRLPGDHRVNAEQTVEVVCARAWVSRFGACIVAAGRLREAYGHHPHPLVGSATSGRFLSREARQ